MISYYSYLVINNKIIKIQYCIQDGHISKYYHIYDLPTLNVRILQFLILFLYNKYCLSKNLHNHSFDHRHILNNLGQILCMRQLLLYHQIHLSRKILFTQFYLLIIFQLFLISIDIHLNRVDPIIKVHIVFNCKNLTLVSIKVTQHILLRFIYLHYKFNIH
jgi:hypothetical protein